jgi:hypothetical protein
MSASGGKAFTLELWLNDPGSVFPMSRHATLTDINYELTEVTMELDLVEVSQELMTNINTELNNGGTIPLPYTSYRSHPAQIASGSSAVINISDSSHNVNAVYSVFRPQTAGTTITAIGDDDAGKLNNRFGTACNPFAFLGGKKKITGTNVTNSTTVVSKYVYRYASKYYPTAPVSLVGDSILALENMKSGFELDGAMKTPYFAETIVVGDKMVPRFECDTFILGVNFKTTSDPILSGLNTSSTGSPLMLEVSFEQSVTAIECMTFVESASVLYIGRGGQSSTIHN